MSAEKPIVTNLNFTALLKTPGRHAVQGAPGLFLKALDERRAYWVFRYRSGGKERETSLGSARKMSLAEARVEHADLTSAVKKHKRDPVAEKRAKRQASAAVDAARPAPPFGDIASDYIATHEGSWRNAKHRWQWSQTLTQYCALIRSKPVDQVATADIVAVLKPIWTTKPETASRLRGRIEFVLNAARALGHIDADRANPARWRGHLDQLLPKRDRLSRGHHAAMPYAEVPALMTRLDSTPGTAAQALAFVILTAARTGEALGMTWDEVDLATATWTVPKERMKAGKTHRVPLSAAALAILIDVRDAARKPPRPDSFVFSSPLPRQPLSNMSLLMLLRRMKLGHFTVHGFRSAFRDWATEVGKVEYATAERCLAHAVGSDAALSYDRSDRLALRRPVMDAWADHVTGKASAKVVPIKARARASHRRA